MQIHMVPILFSVHDINQKVVEILNNHEIWENTDSFPSPLLVSQ